MTREDFGIYIKRVIAGGLAALDGNALSECLSHFRKEIITPSPPNSPVSLSASGRLKSGDLILDVNNISLIGVTNER